MIMPGFPWVSAHLAWRGLSSWIASSELALLPDSYPPVTVAGRTNTRHPRWCCVRRAQRRERHGERRVQQGRLGVCLLTGFCIALVRCPRLHRTRLRVSSRRQGRVIHEDRRHRRHRPDRLEDRRHSAPGRPRGRECRQRRAHSTDPQGSCPHPPVGLRHDGNNRNASQRPAHFAWPTHPQAAIRGATSFSCPRSSFAGKPRGTGGLVPVVGQRPARVLRQSRRPRSSWGTFERFLGYAAKVNAFAPAWMIPFLGTAATVLELLFGVTLVLGLALRWAAFGSAGLLFLFGSAMAISFGIKSPFDYSVFAAMCCALFLGLAGSNRWTFDCLV